MESEAWRDHFGSVYGGPVRWQRIDKEAQKARQGREQGETSAARRDGTGLREGLFTFCFAFPFLCLGLCLFLFPWVGDLWDVESRYHNQRAGAQKGQEGCGFVRRNLPEVEGH